MRKWPVGLIIVALGCLGPRVQTTAVSTRLEPPDWLFENPGPPPGIPEARYLGKFKTTFYWIVEEKDYPDTKQVPLYDTRGNLVGRFSREFVEDFKVEAAGRLRDGRNISWLKKAGRVQVDSQFAGINGYKLTELKSIAVDPRVVPIGAMVYIPQAENVVVNGRRLNGVFRAHDIGSAVKGKHVDIFVGSKDNIEAFRSAGIISAGSVDVYLLE
ncbi:MAG: 3D domain-containing protein [candidate division WOR-3 bacterium]